MVQNLGMVLNIRAQEDGQQARHEEHRLHLCHAPGHSPSTCRLVLRNSSSRAFRDLGDALAKEQLFDRFPNTFFVEFGRLSPSLQDPHNQDTDATPKMRTGTGMATTEVVLEVGEVRISPELRNQVRVQRTEPRPRRLVSQGSDSTVAAGSVIHSDRQRSLTLRRSERPLTTWRAELGDLSLTEGLRREPRATVQQRCATDFCRPPLR